MRHILHNLRLRFRWTSDKGLTSVEFALYMIPMMLLLLGGVETGRYLWAWHTVSAAATEGARMAILNEPSDGEIAARIQQVLVNGGVSAPATATVSARQTNAPVTVSVSVPWTVIGFGGLVSEFKNLTMVRSSSTMVHEP